MLKPARLAVLSGTVLSAAVALTGCAAPDNAYPSLAMRDSERVGGTMAVPVSQPYEAAPIGDAVLVESDRLVEQAQAAHAAFLKTAPTTRDFVRAAQGAPRDSDRWSQAQVAIAELEASRAQLMIALADLDRLTVDSAVAGADFIGLAAKRDEVGTLAETQTQLISAMLASLSS